MPELFEVYFAAEPPTLRSAILGGCWVMDRSWYDQVRAALTSDEQERARAAAHSQVYIAADEGPFQCPACGQRPFATLPEMAEHVMNMGDPDYREPNPGDYLLGLPIVVREGAGRPHLERRTA